MEKIIFWHPQPLKKVAAGSESISQRSGSAPKSHGSPTLLFALALVPWQTCGTSCR
jgi:hypothetical protein